MSTVPGTELDRTRRQFADLSGRLLQAIAGSAKYLPSDEAALLRRLNPKVLAGAALLLATWQYPSRAWSVLGELGDRIMPLFQSACRDEDLFTDPNTFDIDRNPNNHMAFGFGPHTCVGQHLAKLELRVMFEQLLPRLDSIEVLGPGSVTHTNFVGGLKHLPAKVQVS